MKQTPASVFLELESLLLQVERLTAELIAGLNEAKSNIETGLTPALMLQTLLRGHLLYEAQEVAEGKYQVLNASEKEVLSHKLQQLKGFDSQLGDLLQAHHAQIRHELQELRQAQKQVQAYTEQG
jgi:fumarate hydratase class II